MPAFRTTRRVEFRDTDAAGIMHFSAFFTKMEEAEHELWRSLGGSVMLLDDNGQTISWPRVAAHCDYHGAAQFEDQLDIAVSIARLGRKSVSFTFLFHRGKALLATGRITAVCCRLEPGRPPVSVPIPDSLRSRLAPFVVADAGDADVHAQDG
jgi:acyl-CoA thioester hydrolase